MPITNMWFSIIFVTFLVIIQSQTYRRGTAGFHM